MNKPVDDPNPEIQDATKNISLDLDNQTLQIIWKVFTQNAIIQERQRIAAWIEANRTEVAEGVWRDNFTGEYLLKHVVPVPRLTEDIELDYSDFVNIKVTRVRNSDDFTASHWQVDLEDGSGGTAPTFAGVWDTAYEILTDRNGWTDFDANQKEKK